VSNESLVLSGPARVNISDVVVMISMWCIQEGQQEQNEN
jgi:hypothetical protein